MIDQSDVSRLRPVLEFIFSWVILLPISVIVAGKLLAYRFKLDTNSKQLFQIPLFGILEIRARDDEVILGFAGFIVTLLFVGVLGGPRVAELMTSRFGITTGTFNAICVASSFITVLWTAVLFVLAHRTGALGAVHKKHAEAIEMIISGPGSTESHGN